MPVPFDDVSVNLRSGLSVVSPLARRTGPGTCRRREAGPDTGTRHEAFGTREGGVGKVFVTHEGDGVGDMLRRVHRREENAPPVSAIEGRFGGRVMMAMCAVVRFGAMDKGSGPLARSRIAGFTGGDARAWHEVGRNWIPGRFEAGIARHGPVRLWRMAGQERAGTERS